MVQARFSSDSAHDRTGAVAVPRNRRVVGVVTTVAIAVTAIAAIGGVPFGPTGHATPMPGMHRAGTPMPALAEPATSNMGFPKLDGTSKE
jgi:hypothetical protein